VSRIWHCQNPSKVAILASTRPASGGCRLKGASVMPSPPSIAWSPWSSAGDLVMIVMTSPDGSIHGYSAILPDPIVFVPQWNSEQIAGPGSADVTGAPAIAFSAISFGTIPLVAALGASGGVVCYFRRLEHPPPRPRFRWIRHGAVRTLRATTRVRWLESR
jgi:hypothetical protein